MVDAYTQGFRARRDGDTIHQNPFPNLTKDFSDWIDGWKDMDHHLNGRDEALDSVGWFGATPCK